MNELFGVPIKPLISELSLEEKVKALKEIGLKEILQRKDKSWYCLVKAEIVVDGILESPTQNADNPEEAVKQSFEYYTARRLPVRLLYAGNRVIWDGERWVKWQPK